jgi:hypothetical protein
LEEGLMSRNLFWLSDKQWARIEPHLPTDVRGVERADDRRVISGIVHVLKSGCRWCDCDLASRFGLEDHWFAVEGVRILARFASARQRYCSESGRL